MFDQLFCRSDALTRQLSAPLVDERRQYLAHCAAQGMSKCTMEVKARLLLSIAEYLRLAERPNDTIALPEIKKAARRWSRHNWPSPTSSQAKRSREYVSFLRSFCRNAEMRGWCPVGIAASIMAPRVFKHETLPAGPTWDVVQEIVDATAGDRPIAIRDHAILMLLAVYGVRSGEVG